MYKNIKDKCNYKIKFIYTHFNKIVYINFYIFETKALIYYKNKFVLWFLLYKMFSLHCRSPPNHSIYKILNWMEDIKWKKMQFVL